MQSTWWFGFEDENSDICMMKEESKNVCITWL